jgi:hypothetical protein
VTEAESAGDRRGGVSRNVLLLGIVSFFAEPAARWLTRSSRSSQGTLARPRSPSASSRIAEHGAVKFFRWLSDRVQRRLPFVFGGYGIAAPRSRRWRQRTVVVRPSASPIVRRGIAARRGTRSSRHRRRRVDGRAFDGRAPTLGATSPLVRCVGRARDERYRPIFPSRSCRARSARCSCSWCASRDRRA